MFRIVLGSVSLYGTTTHQHTTPAPTAPMAPRNTDLTQPLTEEFIKSLSKAQLDEVSSIYRIRFYRHTKQKKDYYLKNILKFYHEEYHQDFEHNEKEAWFYRLNKALKEEQPIEPIPSNFNQLDRECAEHTIEYAAARAARAH